MTTTANQKIDASTDQCCPKFAPLPWNDKVLEWNNKKFVKDKVFTIFYMPVNFGSVMKRLNAKVESVHGSIPDWLCLADHTSKWNMDIYLAVDKEITGCQNTTLSGKFFTKVYEGDFKETKTWCKDYEQHAQARNFKILKWFMWYTTCPKCAKKYGKNYVVIAAQVE